MKHLVLIGLVALVLTGSGCEESKACYPVATDEQRACDSLSKAVVSAISKNDFTAFSALWVTASDWATFLRSSGDPGSKAEANDSANHARTIRERSRRCFDNVRADGSRNGVVWEKATYKSSTFITDLDHGLTFYRLNIIFDCNGKEYTITADGVVMTPKGMKLNDAVTYGAYEDPMEFIRRMQDSMRIADSLADVEQKRKSGK